MLPKSHWRAINLFQKKSLLSSESFDLLHLYLNLY